MGTGNITGSMAAVYGSQAVQQGKQEPGVRYVDRDGGKEREVYERSREEKEARVRELRESAEEPFAGF